MKQSLVRSTVIALLLSLALLPISSLSIKSVNAQTCQFVLGFQTLHNFIPNIVGDCVDNVHYNPVNGDGLQDTTGGLLVWRKADNFTAFTNGSWTWVNGPYGLQNRSNYTRFSWESDAALYPPAEPIPLPPAPVPAPAPNISPIAWVSNPSPFHIGTLVTVYGRLTLDGVGVPGATMLTTWHYRTTTNGCQDITDSSGTASCGIQIGNATPSYTVRIDVEFNYQGETYVTETYFTPQ